LIDAIVPSASAALRGVRAAARHNRGRMRLLITGGAGFVGANVACGLAARHPDWELAALDNLHRRGSELNLARLREAGVKFVHGDVREPEDLLGIGELDALLECSAEPSALAGFAGGQDYVIKSNLLGAYNCLELARRRGAQFVFLSTSRVYPIAPLRALALHEGPTRFELRSDQPLAGASEDGIAEAFPLHGARTLYGSTKLAAELLIEEYRDAHGLRAVIDRCGVLAGPWQMGKVDQGVFTYWMLAHHFRRPLQYIGFGGHGKQVRDLLHVEDMLELLDEQLTDPDRWDGHTVNVGGGTDCSLSLLETTALCAEITGHRVEIGVANETRPGDVPVYISDCTALAAITDWRPRRGAREVLVDIHTWIAEHERQLERTL
jgi:CDP-paratose 2-epimerase